jgi:capsular polysaccharide biosynthesis protein
MADLESSAHDEQMAVDDLKLLLAEGRVLDALERLKTLRPAFPRSAELATLDGRANLRFGRSAQAMESALEALRLGSEDPENLLVLGKALRIRGRHEESAELLRAAHEALPDRPDAALLLIEETAAAHGFEQAAMIAERVVGTHPDHDLAIGWARLLFAQDPEAEAPAGAVSAPVMSLLEWAAQIGFRPEYIGDRERIPIETPPVYGEADTPRFKGGVPGYFTYAATLRDATIFSKSSIVLMSDGVALNDTIADPRFGGFLDLFQDQAVLARRGQRLLLDLGREAAIELDAGVMMSGWTTDHFGHWVPEYLCRLSYLTQHPRFQELPIIVDSGMPPQHLEYLRLLVSNPIVELPAEARLRCGELVVASPSTFFPTHLTAGHQVPPEHQGGLPLGGFRYLQSRVQARLPPSGSRTRKLFLSRKNRTWRRILNEDALCEALAARGFEIMLPEDMTIEEQVRMFQEAAVVVAPGGSSLINAVFGSTAIKLVILSQRGLFNWGTYYGLMRELGYEVTFVCGDEENDQKHADYSIPLPRLIQALESLET